jgi:nucleoid DNA-binding protein
MSEHDADQHIGKAALAEILTGAEIAGDVILSRRQARQVVELVSGAIADAVVDGQAVHIPGVGAVRQRPVKGRAGTIGGRAYETEPTVSLAIRPASEMRRRLNPAQAEG